jgi:two-component system CheB/CheR fusion protein
MTLADLLPDDHTAPGVRIFATDLDADAIAFARRGIYPARALRNLPDDMVQRHFMKVGDDYEVGKHLRAMLVFGEHDLGQRAPFPRIDLIFCRNVLIYFTPALQRRALHLFAFSLRTDGYLILGKSETVDGLSDYFTVDQPRLKSYRRVGDRVLIPPARLQDNTPAPLAQPRPVSPARDAHHSSRGAEPLSSRTTLGMPDQLLLGLPFGVIVVDRNYDIQYLNSEMRRLFGIHSTALDQDFIHLIRHFDAVAVRTLIDEARTTGQRTGRILEPIASSIDARRTLEVSCMPYRPREEAEDVLLVLTAIDVTEREELRQQRDVAENAVSLLVDANEQVLGDNQELANTIVRLRGKNEELLVAVEEIQAATEEVETLNEELQASNEELETLNEELQATVEELNTTTADMEARSGEMQAAAGEAETARTRLRAVVEGVDGAVALVDGEGTVLLHNAAYAALMDATQGANLIDEDHRPIADDALPLARTARGEPFTMRFAFGQSGSAAWHVATGNPVTTGDGDALGIVTIREVPEP